jgi:soluble P-type ATPase
VTWAVLRLGGVILCICICIPNSGPEITFSTIPELVENLRDTDADLIVVHPDFLGKIAGVAEAAGIPLHRIFLLDKSNLKSSEETFLILSYKT